MRISFDLQISLDYPAELTPRQLDNCSEAQIELFTAVYTELLGSGIEHASGVLYLYGEPERYFWTTKLLKQPSHGHVYFNVQCEVGRNK